MQCNYPFALRHGECTTCLATEKISQYQCIRCGDHQVSTFYQRDCSCLFGYPPYRNSSGMLACHQLSPNQVFIDDEIRTVCLTWFWPCFTTFVKLPDRTCEARQYPSESKTSCNSCGTNQVPQYNEDSANWFCLPCDRYYQSEKGRYVCVDDLCEDQSVFDFNTKKCVHCLSYQYLSSDGDACLQVSSVFNITFSITQSSYVITTWTLSSGQFYLLASQSRDISFWPRNLCKSRNSSQYGV